MADSVNWDWQKFIKGGVIGALTETSSEVPGTAPNPIGTIPTSTNQYGQPTNTDTQPTNNTWLYVGGGVALLLVVVLAVIAIKD